MAIYVAVTSIFVDGGKTIQDIQMVQSFGTNNEVMGNVIANIRDTYANENIKSVSFPELKEIEEENILQLLKDNGHSFPQNKIVASFDKAAVTQLIIDNIEFGRERKIGIIKPLKEIARLLNIDVEGE